MAKQKRKIFSGTPVSEGVRLEMGKYTVFAVRNVHRDIAVRMRREPRRLLSVCMRIPLLRGMVRLIRDVARFFDGINESAELNPQRPVRGTRPERAIAGFLHVLPQTIVTWTTAILLPIIAFVLLYAAPEGTEALIVRLFNPSRTALNIVVCIFRIVAMLFGIGIAGRLRVFKRLLMYKGALNKAINCYEARQELTLENMTAQPLHTRRSEPAFLICVLAVSMAAFAFLPTYGAAIDALLRIGTILAAAAITHEPFHALEEARPTLPVRILRAPMDLLQHMTALEPHPQMLEVAQCALLAALGEDIEEVNER